MWLSVPCISSSWCHGLVCNIVVFLVILTCLFLFYCLFLFCLLVCYCCVVVVVVVVVDVVVVRACVCVCVLAGGGGGCLLWGKINSPHNQSIPVTSRVSHEGVSPVPNTSPRLNSCVSLYFRRGRAVCFLILTSLQVA